MFDRQNGDFMKQESQSALRILVERCCGEILTRDAELLHRAVETIYGNLIVLPQGEIPAWGEKRSFAPAIPRYVGHWNWDSAFYALAMLKWDVAMAREQAEILFEAQHTNGCLPNLVTVDGGSVTNRSQPPVWFWAYWEIDQADPNDDALHAAYDVLCKYEGFWTNCRKTDGLFRYDTDEGKTPYFVKFESGWDTSPRWDAYLPDVLWPIDLNCYMVLAYRSLSYMAKRLGKQTEADRWHVLELELSQLINERLWHKELDAYCDTVIEEGTPTGILTPASFMPLFVEIASDAQAEAMQRLAADPQKFYPLMPSVAYDAEQYAASDYFRGPTWLNIAYTAVTGLKKYGYTALANGFSERILDMCAAEQRGLFEYYDSRTGEGRGACGYGWTAAMLIRLILEK